MNNRPNNAAAPANDHNAVLDESRLLGFDGLAANVGSGGLAVHVGAKVGEPGGPFREEAFASRAGAKVSTEPTEPSGEVRDGGLDFRRPDIAARLGAKVGVEPDGPLLGFDRLDAASTDFRAGPMASKVGAKVGGGETPAPAGSDEAPGRD